MKELRVARLLSMLMIMAVLVSAGAVGCGPRVAPPPEPPSGGVPEGEQPPAGQPPGEQPPVGPQPPGGQPPGEQPPAGPAPGGELPGGPGAQPTPPGPGPQPTPPGTGPVPTMPSGEGCPGPPTFAYFTASPSSISSGQQVELSWGPVTSGASGPLVGSVVLSPGGFGEVGSPGSRWASPTTTTTYRLTATGCGGTVTKDVTVTVGGATSSASPTTAGSSSGPATATSSATAAAIGPIPIMTGVSVMPSPTPTPVVIYDFLSNVSAAHWLTGPPAEGDVYVVGWGGASGTKAEAMGAGFRSSVKPPYSKMEDGSTPQLCIMTRPKSQTMGYISAEYTISGYTLQEHDRVIGQVGLLDGATNGDVHFKIYFTPTGGMTMGVIDVWQTYDGTLTSFDKEVATASYMVGKSGDFLLEVYAGDEGDQDWACWVTARLVR